MNRGAQGGLRWVTIAVSSMPAARAFFEVALGMEPVAAFRILPPLHNSTLLPVGRDLPIVLLESRGSNLCGIRLIESANPSRPPIRNNSHPRDYGYFDVGFSAEDTHHIQQQLVAAGYQCRNVVLYELPRLSLRICESLCDGPDRVSTVFLQRMPSDGRLGLQGVLSAARTVFNARQQADFYREVIGLTLRGDHLLDDEGPLHIVELEPGYKLRILGLQGDSGSGGSVLLLDFLDPAGEHFPGRDLSSWETPENGGIYLWSFEVRDVEATLQRAEKAGSTVLCPPRAYDFAPYSPRRPVATLRAPDGARIELIQAQP